jgi:hypothetical protein
MKRMRYLPVIAFVLCLLVPAFVLAEPPDKGGVPDDYLGDLYGDLYIILRDVNGVPMLDDYGCVQPTRVVDDGLGNLTLVVKQLYTSEADDILCELLADNSEYDDDYADLEFIQEVDFGRLNLGRSPDPVLNHAFDEAVKAMNSASDIQLDPAGRLLLTIPGEDGPILKTIDSPLENLAMYVKMMKDGHWITLDTSTGGKGRGGSGGPPPDKGPPEGDGPTVEERPVLSEAAIAQLADIGYGGLGFVGHTLTNDDLRLAASLIAAAADKSGSFTVDKIVYANSIYGINALGTLPGEVEGKMYFNFAAFAYSKPFAFRSSGGCLEDGQVYVLQPEPAGQATTWEAQCENMMTSIFFKDVDFVVPDISGAGQYAGYYAEGTANVAGFTQAANDALKTIEYIHNYAVPEILVP